MKKFFFAEIQKNHEDAFSKKFLHGKRPFDLKVKIKPHENFIVKAKFEIHDRN